MVNLGFWGFPLYHCYNSILSFQGCFIQCINTNFFKACVFSPAYLVIQSLNSLLMIHHTADKQPVPHLTRNVKGLVNCALPEDCSLPIWSTFERRHYFHTRMSRYSQHCRASNTRERVKLKNRDLPRWSPHSWRASSQLHKTKLTVLSSMHMRYFLKTPKSSQFYFSEGSLGKQTCVTFRRTSSVPPSHTHVFQATNFSEGSSSATRAVIEVNWIVPLLLRNHMLAAVSTLRYLLFWTIKFNLNLKYFFSPPTWEM